MEQVLSRKHPILGSSVSAFIAESDELEKLSEFLAEEMPGARRVGESAAECAIRLLRERR